MQIEWLPGGRIEEGEMILDPIFELADESHDPGLRRLCDEKCRGFIFNFVREYGDLEYVNIGRVVASLSHREKASGRRDVYIAQVKQRDVKDEIVKIIRMQKWGIREHLDDGKRLLDAIIQSEEYTEYILDRRLGCRQLGMNLPARTTAKRISERYPGSRRDVHNAMIWSPYFERDYIRGIATDKIPPQKLASAAFACRFAQLLGQTAAPNMIVGRCDLQGRIVFDDGDEVVIEDRQGLPAEIVVADQMGTFGDYRTELEHFAAEYAAPVNRRLSQLAYPEPLCRHVRRGLRRPLLQDSTGIPQAEAGLRHAFQASSPRRGGELRLSLGMRARPLAAGRAGRFGRSHPQPHHYGWSSRSVRPASRRDLTTRPARKTVIHLST